MFADELTYQCQYCGSINSIEVEDIENSNQVFEETCYVCDRANIIHLTKNEITRQFHIDVHAEID